MQDNRDAVDPRDAARGRWAEILEGLGGIDGGFLADRHGPCPVCPGGEDRFRWDDRDGDGSGYCNVCGGANGAGGSISGTELLMRARGWTFPEAMDRLREHLGIEGEKPVRRKAVQLVRTTSVQHKTSPPPPICDVELAELQAPFPPEPPSTLPQGAILDYSPTQRVKVGKGKDGGKAFFAGHLEGGKWERGAGPASWPLWQEAEVPPSGGGKWIVEAEGEKCADWVRAGGLVAISQPGHSRKVEQIAERYQRLRDAGVLGIVFLSDNDEQGRKRAADAAKAAAAVAMPLLHVPAVDVWPEIPEKGSIDDAPGTAAERVDAFVVAVEAAVLAAEAEEPIPPSDLLTSPKLGDGGEPFEMLGQDKGTFYYYPRETCQVMDLQRASHGTTTNLLSLAGLAWWENRFAKYNKEGDVIGVEWQRAIDWLFREQQGKGIFDSNRLRGLGAWWDNGRVVMHLGDRLVVQGEKRRLWRGIDSDYIYEQHTKLEGPGGEDPLTDAEGARLLALCEGFHWEQSSAGMLLAGWIALAPICGAMRWRPHLWLTAAAGAGKSTILERLVKVLLGDLVIAPGSNATEAGIRQALRSSALPIVFDEAESNDMQEAARMQSVLGLARFASSEGSAQILKGTATGEGTSYRVRTMFLLSSVATALKHGADKTRFSQLTLVKPSGMSEADIQARWVRCDEELRELVTAQAGLRLVARSVALIPMMRDSLEVFSKACAAHMGSTRLGDQYGALCAGAWSLEHQQAPTPEEAAAWLAMYPLGDFAEQSEAADERDCWQTILEEVVQVDLERVATGPYESGTIVSGHVKRSVLSLMQSARGSHPDPDEPVTPRVAKNVLGRHGIKVGSDGETVVVANNAKSLKKLLRGTPWTECYANMLKRVPGAARSSATVHFESLGTARATVLPFPREPR